MAVDSLSWQQGSCLLSSLIFIFITNTILWGLDAITSIQSWKETLSNGRFVKHIYEPQIFSSKSYKCHQFDHAGNPFKGTFEKKTPPHSIKAVVSICIDITIDRWCHQYYGIGTILVAPVSSCCLASSMSTINIIIMFIIIMSLMIIMMLMIILILMPAWSW